MTMSRKHYQAVADILSRVADNIDPDSHPAETWYDIALELNDWFAEDNPRFDSKRFYEAAGVDTSEE